MRRNDSVLMTLLAVAAACLCVAPLPSPLELLRVVSAVPLVLLFPGLAATAALFPTREPALPVRLLLYLAISVSLAALTGYVLNWTPVGLQAGSWAVALAGITAVLAWLAQLRQGAAAHGIGQLGSIAKRLYAGRSPTFRQRAGVLYTLAVLVTVAAFGIDHLSATRDARAGFTQLWLLPSGRHAVRLGVTSHELATVQYQLRVTLHGKVLRSWSALVLRPGQTWVAVAALPVVPTNGAWLDAGLYRLVRPGIAYRSVSLWVNPVQTAAGAHAVPVRTVEPRHLPRSGRRDR
ncbi:MAG: hypothetical protein JWO42_2952 [Chloroflexi bacterium]|nr:hypothetical protein [Chloroflexota bacterium]